jgi:hypothetical protein
MRTPLIAFVFFALTTVPTPGQQPATRPGAPTAERYPVVFDRPLKVGDRFTLKSSVLRVQDAAATPENGTASATTRQTGVELTAACEVLAVSPAGTVARARVTLGRASLTLENGAAEEVEAGTVVQFTNDNGHKLITRERGGPLATPAADALLMGLPLDEVSGGPDGQLIHGPADPKAAGDVWSIDAQRCAGRLLAAGVEIDPADLRGACKLTQTGKMRGEPCARVRVKVCADRLKLTAFGGAAPIPQNWQPVDGSIEMRYSAVLPTDPARHVLTWSDTTRLNASFKVAARGQIAGGTADVVARVKRLFEVIETPAAGGGAVASPVDFDSW